MELDFSQYQALGETGNDGAAAEKWLAEQAQVCSLSNTFTEKSPDLWLVWELMVPNEFEILQYVPKKWGN